MVALGKKKVHISMIFNHSLTFLNPSLWSRPPIPDLENVSNILNTTDCKEVIDIRYLYDIDSVSH